MVPPSAIVTCFWRPNIRSLLAKGLRFFQCPNPLPPLLITPFRLGGAYRELGFEILGGSSASPERRPLASLGIKGGSSPASKRAYASSTDDVSINKSRPGSPQRAMRSQGFSHNLCLVA